MKFFNCSDKWKTDPRAAYIPGVLLVSFILVLCVAAQPAWSFETIESQKDTSASEQQQALVSKYSSSPTVVDSCLPLLKSIHLNSPTSSMDRNQRSAGKAAALSLVLGVRFALSPPTKTKSYADRPRLDLWQPVGDNGENRAALAVSAYRQCQKEQALQAISGFRWTR
ncbi:MAG: hypothetical protein R3E13_11410 [Alphaproteobacteria bacterium]